MQLTYYHILKRPNYSKDVLHCQPGANREPKMGWAQTPQFMAGGIHSSKTMSLEAFLQSLFENEPGKPYGHAHTFSPLKKVSCKDIFEESQAESTSANRRVRIQILVVKFKGIPLGLLQVRL